MITSESVNKKTRQPMGGARLLLAGLEESQAPCSVVGIVVRDDLGMVDDRTREVAGEHEVSDRAALVLDAADAELNPLSDPEALDPDGHGARRRLVAALAGSEDLVERRVPGLGIDVDLRLNHVTSRAFFCQDGKGHSHGANDGERYTKKLFVSSHAVKTALCAFGLMFGKSLRVLDFVYQPSRQSDCPVGSLARQTSKQKASWWRDKLTCHFAVGLQHKELRCFGGF